MLLSGLKHPLMSHASHQDARINRKHLTPACVLSAGTLKQVKPLLRASDIGAGSKLQLQLENGYLFTHLSLQRSAKENTLGS